MVSNYVDPQIPSSLPQLQHHSNRQKEQINQLSSTLASTSFVRDSSNSKHRYYVNSFLLRVYFESDVKCDKKAVTAALLEGQLCQIQRLSYAWKLCIFHGKCSFAIQLLQLFVQLRKSLCSDFNLFGFVLCYIMCVIILCALHPLPS